MVTYFNRKSFDQQIRDAEMHLRKIANNPAYGKDSKHYKARASALEKQKKNYAKIMGRAV